MPKLGYAQGTWFVLVDGQSWAFTSDPRLALELRKAISALKIKRGFVNYQRLEA
jgi:hypothetical protein